MANRPRYTHHVSFHSPFLSHIDKGYGIAKGTGNGEWNAAYVKAKAFVAQMTLEEKVRQQLCSPLLEPGLRINRVT